MNLKVSLSHKSVECFTYNIIVKSSFEHSVVTTPYMHNVSLSLTLSFFLSQTSGQVQACWSQTLRKEN